MGYRIHSLKLMIIHAQPAVAAARKKRSFYKGLHRSKLLRYVIECRYSLAGTRVYQEETEQVTSRVARDFS